ncbi:MAG: ABC transporter permease, partial [Leptospiraceae bacterium]|nr:ABC transporter permease [Leptospiraceae bacterium]
MLTMLHRKVLRNLWGMRAQAVTISLIVASGVATFVSSLSTYESLRVARDNFYRTSRFADVFADLSRAPLSVGERIREIPGLAALELRIVKESLLDVPGEQEPVIGRFVSLPAPGETALNHIHLRNGRFPRHGSSDEVLVNEAFAEANGYRPGDQIAALFHGRYR